MGWRNTVELALFEISNSTRPYISAFRACTSTSRLLYFVWAQEQLDPQLVSIHTHQLFRIQYTCF